MESRERLPNIIDRNKKIVKFIDALYNVDTIRAELELLIREYSLISKKLSLSLKMIDQGHFEDSTSEVNGVYVQQDRIKPEILKISKKLELCQIFIPLKSAINENEELQDFLTFDLNTVYLKLKDEFEIWKSEKSVSGNIINILNWRSPN